MTSQFDKQNVSEKASSAENIFVIILINHKVIFQPRKPLTRASSAPARARTRISSTSQTLTPSTPTRLTAPSSTSASMASHRGPRDANWDSSSTRSPCLAIRPKTSQNGKIFTSGSGDLYCRYFGDLTCGQSYKHFTLVNYDSRVVLTIKLPILRLYSHNIQAWNVL